MRKGNAMFGLVLVLCAASPAGAQVIRGRVLDASTARPVPAATLQLLVDDRPVATAPSDSAGLFTLEVRAPGRYRIVATRIGYQETESRVLELSGRDTTIVELRMAAEPVPLSPLEVNPPDRYLSSVGFYERLQAGMGDFRTAEQIERRNTYSIIDILRSMRGVKIQRVGWRSEVYLASPQCMPQVVLDGVTIRWGGRLPAIMQPLDEIVNGAHVDAIEVYRGGSGAPTQFVGPNAACGIILIWTRHR
ncbi:MAG TPA: carboxypeptidase regulatory-like domain-containing protein [Longimicrobiales bacterium]|nr:carboxypeptidase regulatory-like domain-containing protein [Longimicrobiales bacterium]